MPLIGISGKIGSGKTAVAKLVCEQYDEFERHSFADALKQSVACMLDIDARLCYTRQGKQLRFERHGNKSLGEILQIIGQSSRELVGEHVWLDALLGDYDAHDAKRFWVIDDVRYPNEVARIKALGGIVIRLEGDPAGLRAVETRNLSHEGECALDQCGDFDIVYQNVGGMSALQAFITERVLPLAL
jgi:hypothetical protein